VGGIWGQTHNLDDRTFWPGGSVQATVGRPRPAGATSYGDRHDVRYTDQERSTSNVQLSTFNGQRGDRKGAWRVGYRDRHGVWAACRANRGTGTIFSPNGRIFDTSELTQRPVGRSNRAAATRYGDRHDVRCTDQERPAFNVQRSTFNGVTERAHAGRDMGTDTQFGRTNCWPDGPVQAPVGRSRPAVVTRYGD